MKAEDMEDRVSVATLAEGAAIELVDEELTAVWENIQDPNTESKAKRKVILELTFVPDAEREIVQVQISCRSQMANQRGVASKVSMGIVNGKAVATEYRSRQTDLEEYAENVTNINRAKE